MCRIIIQQSIKHNELYTCGIPADGSTLSTEPCDCVKLPWRCRLNVGGISSNGRVLGICSPVLAKSHKCIANTNSSQPKRPSESISANALKISVSQNNS